MKKTVTTFSVENVSIESTRGRKKIVSELLRTKKTLSSGDVKKLKELQTAQKNLAKLKTKQRKTKSYYAKKSLSQQIKKREKYVQQKFNKTFGIKFDKKTKSFVQKESGKKIARFTKRGTYQVERKNKISLTQHLTERQTSGSINSLDEFEYKFRMSQDIKQILNEYGVIARFSQFVGGTSAGWTRRVMDACGVSDTVTTDEFYDWLVGVGAGGIR